MCPCVCTGVYTRTSRGCQLYHSVLFSWEKNLSLDLKLGWKSASPRSYSILDPLLRPLPSTHSTEAADTHGLLYKFWEYECRSSCMNAGLHACLPATLVSRNRLPHPDNSLYFSIITSHFWLTCIETCSCFALSNTKLTSLSLEIQQFPPLVNIYKDLFICIFCI